MKRSLASGGVWLCCFFAALPISYASGQESFPACETQDGLRQATGKPAEKTPDSCRRLSISRAGGSTDDLCRVDIRTRNEGLFEALAGPAIPEHWWVRCTDLAPTRGR